MKSNGKELLKKVKEKEEQEKRANVTFRLSGVIVSTFKEICRENEVPSAKILEELMLEFCKDNGK